MNAPPFLIAAALLFWGMVHGPVTLVAAVVMALLLEGSRWVPWRWNFDEARMVSIGNVCLIILGGTFAMFYMGQREEAVNLLFTWLPVILTPLMAAQAYSIQEKVPIRVFFPSLRWQASKSRKAGVEPPPDPEIDLSYWYFGLVLIAATVADHRSMWPFVGLVILLAIVLLLDQTSGIGNRPGAREDTLATAPRLSAMKVHPALLSLLLLLVVAGGAFGPFVLYGIQRKIEQLPWVQPNPYADLGLANTRIGDFYRAKQSGKIVYRVKSLGNSPVPSLLQEASYSDYFAGTWRAADGNLTADRPVASESPSDDMTDTSIWKLKTDQDGLPIPSSYSIEISGRLKNKDSGHFALPAGATRLWDLPAATVTLNGYGTVEVTGANSPFQMNVDYTLKTRLEAPPREVDLEWKKTYAKLQEQLTGRQGGDERLLAHSNEMGTIAALAEELQLASLPEKERIERIQDYFRENFTYSLNLARPARFNSDQPLTEFLTRLQRGHCEYFGTTTVLLLRAAGIPARYAVGFSLQEYSNAEKAWLVRSLHGHAWATAYVGGTKVVDPDGTVRWEGGEWIDIDTTPGEWASFDSGGLPSWQPVQDFFSRLWDQFDLWRAEGGFEQLRPYIPWLMGVALLLAGGGSLFGQSRRQRKKRGNPQEDQPIEIPHELCRLESALAKQGLGRGHGETSASWLRRLADHQLSGLTPTLTSDLIDVHYRDRFSPASITSDERQSFRHQVDQILNRLQESPV